VILEPMQTQFFPEPLFFNEPLMNGIQAKIVLMDQNYLETSESRLPYDWAVLQLFPYQKDPRLTNNKMLTCNFDYDFKEEENGLINIPGYPNEEKDFTTFPSREGSHRRIERKDEDICSLYFDENVADSLSQTGQQLFYKHSTTEGSGGSPLLLLDEKATPKKYSVIGVHVGVIGTKSAGVLLRSLSRVD
jgi:V8-like Glu-specific endopeptidase